MNKMRQLWLKWRFTAALVLLCLMALPGVRHLLEASMTRHMLVQFPLLALVGFCIAGSLPQRWVAPINRWNGHGITGLFAAALILAILMIPRVLDLALVDTRVELAKWLALIACGAAVQLSWRRAGLLVQGFFLGNVLPMTAVVGNLFETSPARVCNAYLLDDQVRLGEGLIWIAVLVGLVWFGNLVLSLMRKDAAAERGLSANDSVGSGSI